MKNSFPYPYYFYGSHDSQDTDVLISIPQEDMPTYQEDRKRFVKKLEEEYELSWNVNLVVIKDGIVVDTIYPKTWIDSVNNSLFNTYKLHNNKQLFPLPIKNEVKRNKLLAIYKTLRTVLSMLSRTHYRTTVKPILKGIHHFNLKLEALQKIDFTTVDIFNQDNVKDEDIWKIIAFYIGQNKSLIKDNIEIYTKTDLCKHHPELSDFVYRKEITLELKKTLNEMVYYYIYNILIPYGKYICDGSTLYCLDETIDMKNEISL